MLARLGLGQVRKEGTCETVGLSIREISSDLPPELFELDCLSGHAAGEGSRP